MKSIRFHPEAEAEMVHAATWYEAQQKDLGKRFLSCVQDTVNKIQHNPELYAPVDPGVRRCLTRTFPYGVLFQVRSETILIMAVMHLHRDPDYWKLRR